MNETPRLGTARTTQRASLASKFSTEIGDLLPPLPAAPPATDPAPSEPSAKKKPSATKPTKPAAPEPAMPMGEPAPAPVVAKPVKRQQQPSTIAEDGSVSKADLGLAVSIPQSVMDRLEAYRHESGESHPTVLFNAIESTYAQLPELIKAASVQPAGAAEGGQLLFNRPAAVARRSTKEPKATFIIRVSKENKDILTRLTAELGAPSRNALCAAAYDAYLPKP